MDHQNIIGWREWLALPELGVPAIKAKIDTGARTSALHVFDLEKTTVAGRDRVSFNLHPLQKRLDVVLPCSADILDERVVRDSGGHEERRFVIATLVRVAGKEWPIEITLTNRENMLFRMLLGRTALPKGMLVDCHKSYMLGKRPPKVYQSIKMEKS